MTVRSSFFEYPGQGGPVMVSVLSNMDEKPDWTGLPSTTYSKILIKCSVKYLATQISFPVTQLPRYPDTDTHFSVSQSIHLSLLNKSQSSHIIVTKFHIPIRTIQTNRPTDRHHRSPSTSNL